MHVSLCVWVSACESVCVSASGCVRASGCRVHANTHASSCVCMRKYVRVFECDFVRVQVLESESKGECMQMQE